MANERSAVVRLDRAVRASTGRVVVMDAKPWQLPDDLPRAIE
jgi:hypothetical protein